MKKILETLNQKWTEYLLEILVIVVGIIVAFTLNNWNEKRKQASNFDKLIDGLENEISENLDEANYEIRGARNVQIDASRILQNKITKEEFLEDRSLRSIIELNRLDINSDDVSSLVKRQEDFPRNYKKLIPHLKNYLKIEERYRKSDSEYAEQISGYSDFLIKTQSWYASSYVQVLDSLALNKQIDFYLENPVYKNYLTSYIDGYRYSLREMIGIRSACLVILAEIKRIRGNIGADEIAELFSHYSIIPYPEKTCDFAEVSRIDYNEPSSYLPLFNSSNQSKTIQWIDAEKKTIREIQLKPGEIGINPASKRMQANVLIEIVTNGECSKKYQAKRNGFLLIQ